MSGEAYQYSLGYIIRNINTVKAKGWKGFSLVREIECECKRLNVDPFEVLRSYAIHKLNESGDDFDAAFRLSGTMSCEDLKNFLS